MSAGAQADRGACLIETPCQLCKVPSELDEDGLCDGCAQAFWVDIEPAPRPITTIEVVGGLL